MILMPAKSSPQTVRSASMRRNERTRQLGGCFNRVNSVGRRIEQL
jgi:hypothetical protein